MTSQATPSADLVRTCWLIALVAVAGFDLLGSLVLGDNEVTRFDRWASAWCEAWGQPRPAAIAGFVQVTSLGDTVFLALISLACVVGLLFQRRPQLALAWATAALVAAPLNSSLKLWYGRPRPQFTHALVVIPNPSFPSGHAMGSAVVYGLIGYLVLERLPSGWPRRIGLAMVGTIIVGVAISRVVLGAHWPSDSIAGVLIGLGWVAVCVPLLRTMGQKDQPSGLAAAQSGSLSANG